MFPGLYLENALMYALLLLLLTSVTKALLLWNMLFKAARLCVPSQGHSYLAQNKTSFIPFEMRAVVCGQN